MKSDDDFVLDYNEKFIYAKTKYGKLWGEETALSWGKATKIT